MTSHKVLKISDFNFSQFQTVIGLVTPELANELLKLNMENNRNVGLSLVTKYAREMSEGQWILSDPIKFSSEGELIDGQHRLNAVVKSGTSQLFVFILGYPKDSAEVLDQGKIRTAKDIARIRGTVLGSTDVSIFRMIYEMSNNPTGKGGFAVLPSRNVATACMIYKERLDFSCSYSGKKNAIRYAPVLSAVFAAYPYEDHQRLLEFLECWHSGVVVKGTGDNSAIALRRTFSLMERANGGRTVRMDVFGKAQSALKAFLKNQSLEHIRGTSKIVWDLQEFKHENLIRKIKEFDAQ
jgi:hypothetical protein